MKNSVKVLLTTAIIFTTVVSEAYCLEFEGGISTRVNADSSAQGNLAADNNGATFEAYSVGVANDFNKDHSLNFGNGYTANSKIGLIDGSIGIYSEITKLSGLGTETNANLIAQGSHVDVGLSGTKSSSSTDQSAGVENGVLVSSLGLHAGNDVSAYQNTAMQGDNGFISSSALSKANNFAIDSGFSGYSRLNTELLSTSGEGANILGSASLNGNTLIDNKNLQYLSTDSISLQISNTFTDTKGNSGDSVVSVSNTLSSPATGELSPGYKLYGFRWPRQTTTKVVLYTSGTPSDLDKNRVRDAYVKAKGMWSSQCFELNNFALYYNTGNLIPSYTGARDYANTVAWTKNLPNSINSQTTTWYSTDSKNLVKGNDGKYYYKALESDTWLNANDIAGESRWNLCWDDRGPVIEAPLSDVRTAMGISFGHTFGLASLSNTLYKDQLMWYSTFDRVDWSLGKGDIAGIKKLYG